MANRIRNERLEIKLTKEEKALFEEKRKLARCRNMSHFIRKCVLEKEIYQIDLEPFRDLQGLLGGEDLKERRNVLFGEDIVVHILLVKLFGGRINKLNLCALLMLGKYKNVGCYRRTVKEPIGEGNDSLHIVVIDQIFTDFLFCASAIKDARETDNRRPSAC